VRIRYRTNVTVTETLLVFVAIPGGIIALIAIAVFGKSAVRQPNRYRPGKAWTYGPTWYVPHPDAVVQAHSATARAIESGTTTTTAVGGASGEW
jgi:hypothetical protein